MNERQTRPEGKTDVAKKGREEEINPLIRAYRIQAEAGQVGFDWGEVSGPLTKLREEVLEVEEAIAHRGLPAIKEEVGDLLFTIVNLTRWVGVDPSEALQVTNAKFTRRFSEVRRLAQERGIPIPGSSLKEMDLLWEEVKREESTGA